MRIKETENQINEIVDRHCRAFFGTDWNTAKDFKIFNKALKNEIILLFKSNIKEMKEREG